MGQGLFRGRSCDFGQGWGRSRAREDSPTFRDCKTSRSKIGFRCERQWVNDSRKVSTHEEHCTSDTSPLYASARAPDVCDAAGRAVGTPGGKHAAKSNTSLRGRNCNFSSFFCVRKTLSPRDIPALFTCFDVFLFFFSLKTEVHCPTKFAEMKSPLVRTHRDITNMKEKCKRKETFVAAELQRLVTRSHFCV